MSAAVIALRQHAAFVSRMPAKVPLTREEVAQEIKNEMAQAMSGETKFVPGLGFHGDTVAQEALIGSAQAVTIALSYDVPAMTMLMTTLQHSPCPLVQKLRDSIAEGYAAIATPDVATVRGITQ